MALSRVSTGIPGLDDVLDGGFVAERSFQVRGGPGTGKTTLALHFLNATSASSLLILLSEPERQVRTTAEQFGLSLDNVSVLDLSPKSDYLTDRESYDIVPDYEADGLEIAEHISRVMEELEPERVAVDALTHLQYVAPSIAEFRKETLSLLKFLQEKGATVVFTSEPTEQVSDDNMQFLTDAVLELDQTNNGRRCRVTKFRGSSVQRGWHSINITDQGLQVYPTLQEMPESIDTPISRMSTGVDELDQLLQGGLSRGTTVMLSGPTGVGKTTLTLQCMKAVAERGGQSLMYNFEESIRTLRHRAEAVDIPVGEMSVAGDLDVQTVRPGQMTIGRFVHEVCAKVESEAPEIVGIDSLRGVRKLRNVTATPIRSRVENLCRYLRDQGVTVVMTEEVSSITGPFQVSDNKVSHLADTIVFIRYLEIGGELRKAIGVLKERTSSFEQRLREFSISADGISVGVPLTQLRGILEGEPEPISRSSSSASGSTL